MEKDPLNLQTLLPDLDPPPGGWARLRRRIAEEAPSKRRRPLSLLPIIAGVAVTLFIASLFLFRISTERSDFRSMLQPGANTWALGLHRPQSTPQTGHANRTAFTKVAETPTLVWYQAISLNRPSPSPNSDGELIESR